MYVQLRQARFLRKRHQHPPSGGFGGLVAEFRGFGMDEPPKRGNGDPFEQLKRNANGAIAIAVLVVLGLAASSSFFTVAPEEEAVILRFGTPIDDTFGPGLHFKVPLVDQVFIVPVERQHRLELGFRSEPGEQTREQASGAREKRDALMLTGDLSLAVVSWSVLYKVKDIQQYLFNVKAPEETVRDVAMGAMRTVIGDYSLDEILTGQYDAIADSSKRLTQRALDDVGSGIQITAVAIKSTEVPLQARAAFDDLNKSVAEVKRQVVEAYARRKQIRGQAEQRRQTVIGAAEARRAKRVENATGEANAFLAQLEKYRQAPDITRKWLYLEAVNKSLKSLEQTLVLDGNEGDSSVLKLLPLNDMIGTKPSMVGAAAAGALKGAAKASKGGAR